PPRRPDQPSPSRSATARDSHGSPTRLRRARQPRSGQATRRSHARLSQPSHRGHPPHSHLRRPPPRAPRRPPPRQRPDDSSSLYIGEARAEARQQPNRQEQWPGRIPHRRRAGTSLPAAARSSPAPRKRARRRVELDAGNRADSERSRRGSSRADKVALPALGEGRVRDRGAQARRTLVAACEESRGVRNALLQSELLAGDLQAAERGSDPEEDCRKDRRELRRHAEGECPPHQVGEDAVIRGKLSCSLDRRRTANVYPGSNPWSASEVLAPVRWDRSAQRCAFAPVADLAE
ncbi:MAG: hypothetical protein JWR53_1037, partial [Glaciihabitans sp.]|nr:hypothetical protein [Glaciihabitans sp.]